MSVAVGSLGCTASVVRSILGSGFSEKIKKMISRICEKASKNPISRNIAPKIMKQIL
jgi:hypothetical protein